jgi:hypothetical protein
MIANIDDGDDGLKAKVRGVKGASAAWRVAPEGRQRGAPQAWLHLRRVNCTIRLERDGNMVRTVDPPGAVWPARQFSDIVTISTAALAATTSRANNSQQIISNKQHTKQGIITMGSRHRLETHTQLTTQSKKIFSGSYLLWCRTEHAGV